MGSLAACSDNGEAGGEIPSADPPIELRATYPDTSISTKAEVRDKNFLICNLIIHENHFLPNQELNFFSLIKKDDL